MDQVRFFESVVEPSTERLMLLGIAHDVNFDRRNFIVTHRVSKHVFTSFDARLSRYLSAVRGAGLPHATVETRIRDVATGRAWTPYPRRYCASVPDALATAAKLALGSGTSIAVRMGAWVSRDNALDQERVITAGTVAALEQVLDVCDRIGPADFLEISGDLDRATARPPGVPLRPIEIDLLRDGIAVPGLGESGATAHRGRLSGLAEAIRTVPAAGAWFLRARQAVAAAREEAIHRFRDSAEERILQVHAALGHRPLTGYRLEAATSLVARLQAGLGISLRGLNEAAQITALDWAAVIRGDADPALGGGEGDHEDQVRLVG